MQAAVAGAALSPNDSLETEEAGEEEDEEEPANKKVCGNSSSTYAAGTAHTHASRNVLRTQLLSTACQRRTDSAAGHASMPAQCWVCVAACSLAQLLPHTAHGASLSRLRATSSSIRVPVLRRLIAAPQRKVGAKGRKGAGHRDLDNLAKQEQRMLKNRESAARSRLRRQQHTAQLEQENEELRAQVELLNQQVCWCAAAGLRGGGWVGGWSVSVRMRKRVY